MTKNTKVVAYLDTLAKPAREMLAARPDIVQQAFAQHPSHDHFLAYLKSNPAINALILGGQRVGVAEVPASPSLEVVARIGVGYDMIDQTALAPRRIPLMTAGTANSPSVAEEAFHLIFALIKRSREHDRLVREGRWTQRMADMPGDIYGKTMVVVGFGRIGSRVVRRALAMEMHVHVYDPYVSPADIKASGATPISRLDDALPLADVLTLHCPKTPETVRMVDARRLALLKPTALLINTARGGIVDEAALLVALQNNKLAGAGLDVLEQEPPPAEHPLFKAPNVIFAPHMAGVTREALDRMSIASVERTYSRCSTAAPSSQTSSTRTC
jgi:D-3-phosphoglycerate dehydrogenase / 2-oxoglutarate reductase